MINVIVAMSKNRVIGFKNKLPWNITEDLEWFRSKTINHPCIMGRKTLESLGKNKDGKQRILVGRSNIVITRQLDYKIPGINTFNAIESGIDYAQTQPGSEEIFICGGSEIYNQILAKGFADKLYITLIDEDVKGDTYFPELPEEFKLIEEKKRVIRVNDKEIRYSFQIYIK